MSLEAILNQIYASGDAQIREIEKEAQARVGEVLAHARMEAQQIEEDASASASAPAARERARILHRARLEALRMEGSVREELVETALQQTREKLACLRNSEIYSQIFPALAREALTGLTGSKRDEKAVLVADQRDQALLKKTLNDLGADVPVKNDLECWGGVIAQSNDGRVVVINTLEARLERAMPFLRGQLAAFFENELETDT